MTINAAAGSAQRASERPVITRAHGVFSAAEKPSAGHRPLRAAPAWPLLVVGGLGALAFAVENAHHSWSAVSVLAHIAGLSFEEMVAMLAPVAAVAGGGCFAALRRRWSSSFNSPPRRS